MRVLRSTLRPPSNIAEPVTTVMRDRDLKLPIEDAMKDLAANPTPGGKGPPLLVLFEVFEMPDDYSETGIVVATMEAKRRMDARAEAEQNLEVLFYWNAMQLAKGLGRVIVNQRPAPLSAVDMEPVLEQLARIPEMKGRTLMCVSKEYVVFTVTEGRVEKAQPELTRKR